MPVKATPAPPAAAATPAKAKAAKKILPAKPEVPSSDSAAPAAPKVELHKELIPKDISIARCYYAQEVAPPGTTFGFDIDGSGFTSEFEQMISVKVDEPGVRFKDLRLVTPNQIHGDIEVGSTAATKFVFPKVLIKGLPVFSAPEPFAVIRPGEVLAIFFVEMQDNGRGGRFRVLTNLTTGQAALFKIEPSTPGLLVSNMDLHLPYAIDADLRIGPGVQGGEYGLSARLGDKEVFRRNGMIRIVKPNVGSSGLIHGITAEEPYHRPGDAVQLYLQGTGLSPNDAATLLATVKEFDMGRGSFTYISPSQMRFDFNASTAAPLGDYSITIKNAKGETVFDKNDVFHLIAANWIAGAQVTPPVHPGQKSTLKVMGRDLSAGYVQQLRIETDAPGIAISSLRPVNVSTLEADIAVSSTVAPGDYWLHLSAGGKKINPPYGSIIKVEP